MNRLKMRIVVCGRYLGMRRALVPTVALLLGMQIGRADVKPSALFSDHAVLQSDEQVAVWGTAEPGEEVHVAYLDQNESCTADSNGKWKVHLRPMPAGAVGEMKFTGRNTLVAKDVLTGEVWLCSGQSNMARPLTIAMNAKEEIAAANHPNFRMFVTEKGMPGGPADAVVGKWLVCTPENAPSFSATGYFFGRDLQEALGRPVGLIVSAVGSTRIQSWISSESLEHLPIFAKMKAEQAEEDAIYEKRLSAWKANPSEKRPKAKYRAPFGALFNGMIAPLASYEIKGVIWYQGEANARSFPASYGMFLSALIENWRKSWGKELPFAWVQLPAYRKAQKEPVEEADPWPMIREGMLQTLHLSNTGMIVTLDAGEADNIHPHNKQVVGKRLAMWALAEVYGKEGTAALGPIPTKFEIRNNEIAISFSHTEGGLVAKDGKLDGFAIAGDDRKWIWADARIDGDQVIVSSAKIPNPVSVRYAWADNPVFSLSNKAGLLASPFRSDEFPLPEPDRKNKEADEE